MDDETLPAADDRSLGGELVMTATAEVVRAADQEDEDEQ